MNNRQKGIIKDISVAVFFLVLATITGIFFKRQGFTEPNIVVIYILAILLIARFTEGYVYGVIASFGAILGFNYFFTEPYHTLDVYDPAYFVTFAIMALTSIITSTLTSKAKLYTIKVKEKELESRVLYQLINQLSDADNVEDIMKVALSNICALTRVDAGFLYFESEKKQIFIQQNGEKQVYRTSEETKELWGAMLNLRTEYLEEHGYLDFPVHANEKLIGAIRIEQKAGLLLVEEKKRLIHSMIDNTGIALDRIVMKKERIRDREAIVRERYRSNLLRAISHDLRTPLTGIMGTAEMLLDMTQQTDRRREFMWDIYQDADWLHSLVENILSLTRLQDGNMSVRKEPEALEEVIASAVGHIEKIYKGREVRVCLPEQFFLIPMDARLIQQVIHNLLDNAVKHTTPEEAIIVQVEYTEERAIVHVMDEGEGMKEKDIGNIFQMFYTTQEGTVDAKKGIGLGLAICKTVVKAHGGNITGKNREDQKGAIFTFWLPRKEDNNLVQ